MKTAHTPGPTFGTGLEDSALDPASLAPSAHTPGPWKIDEAEDLPLAVIADNENGDGICEVADLSEIDPKFHPMHLANARLIAAAPDLLAALTSALYVMQTLAKGHGYDTSIGVVPQARAAIRAATGGSAT